MDALRAKVSDRATELKGTPDVIDGINGVGVG